MMKEREKKDLYMIADPTRKEKKSRDIGAASLRKLEKSFNSLV